MYLRAGTRGPAATPLDADALELAVPARYGASLFHELVKRAEALGGEVTVLLIGSDQVPAAAELQTALQTELRRNVSVRIVVTPVEVIDIPASGS